MNKILTLIFLVSLSIAFLSTYPESSKPSQLGEMESQIINGKVKSPELWLEVHDVSPGWEYWRLQQLLEVAEKHEKAISKTILFVIPNHANVTPLYRHPEYVAKLQILEEGGHVIGMHGYVHDVETPEFNNSKESTERIIKLGLDVFEKSNLTSPEHFAPPVWTISQDNKDLLESAFDYVYYGSEVKTPDGIKKYIAREYTWNTNKEDGALELAQSDYLDSDEVFRLVVHMGAVNNPENLEFISEFLTWVEINNERA